MPERISHSCAFTALASGWSWTPCGIAFTAGHQLFEVTAMRFTTQWVRLRRRAAPGRRAAIAVPPPRRMRIRCHQALPVRSRATMPARNPFHAGDCRTER